MPVAVHVRDGGAVRIPRQRRRAAEAAGGAEEHVDGFERRGDDVHAAVVIQVGHDSSDG